MRFTKSFVLLLVIVFLININYASACTNFLFSKGATVDGSTMITYVADSHTLYGELYFWPAADYPEGTMLDIYEWDTGTWLSKIKQVQHTYQVIGNMNEYQVAVGETTFGGKEELRDTTALIDYGSLMYVGLQRAKTAREMIKVMTDLATEYGYFSEGESFSVSDPNECWILEMVGKGVGSKGAVWVARRVPDGYICGHANQSRITTFPLNDPENCVYAKDVITFAREKKYFKGEDKNFSFADAYNPLSFEGIRMCDARVWSGFNKVNKDMKKYLDYAMGYNNKNRMPLWVKPDKKLTVHDVFNIMRDHFEGTPMDLTNDVGAGPYACPYRWRPLTWKLDTSSKAPTYFNERAISTQQTGFSFIAQSRSWLPNPIGGIFWFGVDDTYSTVYTPMYCGMSSVPPNYAVGNGDMMDFSDSSLFWIFNQVSNFAYTRYNAMIPEIQKVQGDLEYAYFASSAEIDKEAEEIYKTNPSDAIKIITEYSLGQGKNTFNTWKDLYHYLFTKYMDGNIKYKVPGQKNPRVWQPGYSKETYEKIVKETKERFKEPEEKHE